MFYFTTELLFVFFYHCFLKLFVNFIVYKCILFCLVFCHKATSLTSKLTTLFANANIIKYNMI